MMRFAWVEWLGELTLFTSIGMRELPIPKHMDIFHLTTKFEANDMSSVQVS